MTEEPAVVEPESEMPKASTERVRMFAALDPPRFWRSGPGALLCDRAVEGLTVELPEEARRSYGGRWVVGECLLESAARRIVAALGATWGESDPEVTP